VEGILLNLSKIEIKFGNVGGPTEGKKPRVTDLFTLLKMPRQILAFIVGDWNIPLYSVLVCGTPF
jgi:hypothetical protein